MEKPPNGAYNLLRRAVKNFSTFFVFPEIFGVNLIYLYIARFVHCSQWRF